MRLLLLLCLLSTAALAQSVGDFILNEKTSSTGRVTPRYWPKASLTLWGTTSGSLPSKIVVGTGLSLGGSPLTLTATGGGSGGATTLDELTDVTITTATTGQVLRYNGTAWVNYTHGFLTSSDLSSYATTAAVAAGYQPLDSDLTSIAALTTTTHGRSLLTDANAAASRSTLGLGSLATQSATISDYLTTATAASTYGSLAGASFTGLISAGNGITTPSLELTGGSEIIFSHASSAGSVSSKLLINESAGTERDAVNWYLRHNLGGTIAVLTDLNTLNGSNITSGTVADARLSGSVSLLGQTISLTTEVTGTLPIANGGTGETTASTARIALLPSMTGNGGKFLRVNAGATDYEVATISGGGDALTSGTLAQFAATTSAQLRGVLSDESGTGEILTTTGSAAGLTSFPTLNQSTTGNAGTATALATGRTLAITGDLTWTSPSFDGSGNVTAAGTLATVASAGTTGSSTAIPVVTINAKGLTTGITTADVIAPAGTLTGSTLASGVTASSLTSLGTIATGVWQGTAIGDTYISSAATWNAKEAALTFSTGLTRSTNTITVNTSQNIATLSNLTSNGFVKTTGGTGTLSVDTSTYLTTTGNGSSLTGITQSQVSGLTTTDRPQFANIRPAHSTLTYAATTNIDLDGDGFQTVTLTGTITFTTSNRAAGRSRTVRIVGDSSSRSLTWPAGWTWVGAAAPTALAANKDAILTITAFGTADTDIVAAYAVEP